MNDCQAQKKNVCDDADSSPVRRQNKSDSEDLSPIRKSKRNVGEDEDLSPVRKMSEHDTDLSPVRKSKPIDKQDSDISPIRRRNKRSDDDLSPVRPGDRSRSLRLSPREMNQKKGSSDRNKKADLTLDGKLAGLQDATMLKKETEEFRRRENDLFKKMSGEVSGQHADVVVRDKKSGRVRDLERDREKDEEKKKREKERQEVYSRWGKGLKQVEDYQNKVADDKYESNKPLARYSNDADLDKMLRDQERAGDPMLAYIRKKNNQNASGPKVPTYDGPFPENRFNIRPGYRWDGVDRSNGYEKKWLMVQNQKVAIRDEAYKYSTEDM